jgi:putative nucleotidyltransferase with HDIG domain
MESVAPLIVEHKPRVLVVDDEPFIRDILADFLAMEGYSVRTADDGRGALAELRNAPFDVIVTDLKMPNIGGLELLREVTVAYPSTLTVIMTGFGTVETAIDAMKQGAYDYVLKPFKADEIIQVVSRAVRQRRLTAENLRLREAVSLYKVSEAISASLSMDEVVTTITDATVGDAHADWVETWLDDGEGSFSPRDTGIREGFESPALELSLPLVQARLKDNKAVLEHTERAAAFFLSADLPRVESLILAPLLTRGRQLGFIAAASFSTGKAFDEGKRKMVSMIASRAAAAIDNAELYQNLQATFAQTIQSLARTIDKMDRYTSGHSERVARYAQRLARQLGLDEGQIEVVRQAALMHDIGKIGCVMNLNKPNKLTQDEYEAFKRHPAIGKDILDPIQFLQPVIPGVHLHHERWDGRGYPLGLSGSQIPLIARIISVADTYDAMTSNRAYRRAMPHEVTLDELGRCAGHQFDPDVAGEFRTQVDEWLEEWRSQGLVVPE